MDKTDVNSLAVGGRSCHHKMFYMELYWCIFYKFAIDKAEI